MSILDTLADAFLAPTTVNKENLQPASFRSVPFLVDDLEWKCGRNTAKHEFPKRASFSEDISPAAGPYTFSAYVLGDDFDVQAKRLEAACNQEGPGVLVHPFHGTKKVVCEISSVKWGVNESRSVRFTLNFQETSDVVEPEAVQDAISAVNSKSSSLLDAAASAFNFAFNVVNTAGQVVDAAQRQVTTIANNVKAATAGIRATTAKIADLAVKLRQLKANVLSIIRTPADLARALQNAIGLYSGLVSGGDRKAIYDGLSKILPYAPILPLSTTPSRAREAKNQAALSALVRQTTIANAANELAAATFATREDAIAARETLLTAIDSEMESTEDDEVYNSLHALRASVITAVPAAGADLPQLINYTPPVTINALALQYELYGSLAHQTDLLSRNRVQHPGFLSGGRVLALVQDDGKDG